MLKVQGNQVHHAHTMTSSKVKQLKWSNNKSMLISLKHQHSRNMITQIITFSNPINQVIKALLISLEY